MDDDNKQAGQSSHGDSTGTGATGTAARMKEQIAETAADVKEKVNEFGRKAADKIDDSRQSLPALWTRQLPHCTPAATNCRA